MIVITNSESSSNHLSFKIEGEFGQYVILVFKQGEEYFLVDYDEVYGEDIYINKIKHSLILDDFLSEIYIAIVATLMDEEDEWVVELNGDEIAKYTSDTLAQLNTMEIKNYLAYIVGRE